MWDDLRRDLRYSLRTLRRSPGFTAVAVLALALGIGANTTVMSIVEVLLTFTLPVAEPERVSFVFGENPARGVSEGPVSVDDFLDWREGSRSFEQLVAARPQAFNFRRTEEAMRVEAFAVSSGLFALAGTTLAQGRGFLRHEEQPGEHRVAVLSYGCWQQLGGDAEVLGTQLALDGESYTVVGVAREDFFFPDRSVSLWVPLVLEPGRSRRDQRSLFVVGLLRPGTNAEVATTEVQTIARRLAEAHPETNQGWTARVVGLRENQLQGSALALAVLYGSITFVLLIACANVASLLVSRATVRQREMVLRTALGAGRRRLMRQLLTESLLLSLVGGAIGLVLGAWGIEGLRTLLAGDVNIGMLADEMGLSFVVLAHTLGISLLAAVLFGLVPALQTSKPKLYETLKDGARGADGGSRRRLRGALVVGEVTLALALLGTTGALLRAFQYIYSADPGFNPRNLLTLQVSLPPGEFTTTQEMRAFYGEAQERLASLPGVASVTQTTTLPLTLFSRSATTHMDVEGELGGPLDDESPNVVDLVVGPDYLETFEISLVAGRGLSAEDREDSLPVALVSEATVERFWPETEPLGQRFKLKGGDDEGWIRVVGVVEDIQTHAHSLRSPTLVMPHVFLPLAQHPRATTFFVLRTEVEPTSVAPMARRALLAVERGQPAFDVLTMAQVIARADTQNVVFIQILSGLSLIALVLAGIGIYGIISFAVEQRRQEIGIRLALGARPRNILLLVTGHGALLTATGLALGSGLAWVLVRLMETQLEALHTSHANGPLTFVGVAVVLLAVANFASLLPARRAVDVDPVVTLRYE